MSIFVINPAQLYYGDSILKQFAAYEHVYIIEDPAVLQVYDVKKYRQYLAANKIPSKFITRAKVMEKNGTIFDYLIGVQKFVTMYRLESQWTYGDAIYDYTYNGLPVRFVENPSYIYSYRELRDTYLANHKYNFAPFYKKAAEKLVKTHNAPKEILNINLAKFTPMNFINDIVENICKESQQFIYDLIWREYMHMLYLINQYTAEIKPIDAAPQINSMQDINNFIKKYKTFYTFDELVSILRKTTSVEISIMSIKLFY